MIFFIHGFNLNIKNNINKIKELEDIFNEEVKGLEYIDINPFDISLKLSYDIDAYKDEENLYIGNSLGGFWAERLADLTSDNCAIFNPCYIPSVYLKGMIEDDILDLYQHFEHKTQCPKYVFIGKHDELIDPIKSKKYYQTHSKVIEFEGKHEINTFIPFKKELLEIKENIQLY